MKINTIYHKKEEITKERKNDVFHVKHSKSEVHHPFMEERELVRALNYTKMERMFAKPFVTAFSYHKEGITHLVKHTKLPLFASASFDNNIIVWDFSLKTILNEYKCENIIKGIAIDENSNVYSGQKNYIQSFGSNIKYLCSSEVQGLTLNTNLTVACLNKIDVFDLERKNPIMTIDSHYPSVIGSSRSLKNVVAFSEEAKLNLLDIRMGKTFTTIEYLPVINSIEFSPQEPNLFAVGDGNKCATLFDIRYTNSPKNKFIGHTDQVMCLSFSPDGTELATGSLDKTIRIFPLGGRTSRDVYYNRRMQNVLGLEYSNDSHFIISGSDEGSIRLWKSHASSKSGPLTREEKNTLEYSDALKEKYKDVGEIKRIGKHRFLPRKLKNNIKAMSEQYQAEKRKQEKRQNPQNK